MISNGTETYSSLLGANGGSIFYGNELSKIALNPDGTLANQSIGSGIKFMAAETDTPTGGSVSSGWNIVFRDVSSNPTLTDDLTLPATFDELFSRGTSLEGEGYFQLIDNFGGNNPRIDEITFSFIVPEPSSSLSLSLGAFALIFLRRRK